MRDYIGTYLEKVGLDGKIDHKDDDGGLFNDSDAIRNWAIGHLCNDQTPSILDIDWKQIVPSDPGVHTVVVSAYAHVPHSNTSWFWVNTGWGGQHNGWYQLSPFWVGSFFTKVHEPSVPGVTTNPTTGLVVDDRCPICQVSIERQDATGAWGHQCSGALVAENAVLTAAGCAEGGPASALRVVSSDGSIHSIAQTIPHESYNSGQCTFANDIALIELSPPVNIKSDQELCSISTDPAYPFVGRPLRFCGSDRTGNLSYEIPNVISNEEAQSRLSGIPGAQVCDSQIATYDGQTAICFGDQGSPLFYSGTSVVAGIASWSIISYDQCSPSYPSVYTKVPSFAGWIHDNASEWVQPAPPFPP
jgi:hypothetical protein